MLKIIPKRPPLDIFVSSKQHFVTLKDAVKFDSAVKAIGFAAATNQIAFHVTSKDGGGLRYEKLFPLSDFAIKLKDVLNRRLKHANG